MNATTTASARLHLDTAIALVGREQVVAWLETPIPVQATTAKGKSTTTVRRTVAATVAASAPAAAATVQRGRKAGALPPPDQRCSWTLTSGEQCSNKKKDGSFCGLHIGKIQLIDPTAGAACVSGSDAAGDDDDE